MGMTTEIFIPVLDNRLRLERRKSAALSRLRIVSSGAFLVSRIGRVKTGLVRRREIAVLKPF